LTQLTNVAAISGPIRLGGNGMSISSISNFNSLTANPLSTGSDPTIIFNNDPSFLEQNGESLAVDPASTQVIIGSANDYRHVLDNPEGLSGFAGVGPATA